MNMEVLVWILFILFLIGAIILGCLMADARTNGNITYTQNIDDLFDDD